MTADMTADCVTQSRAASESADAGEDSAGPRCALCAPRPLEPCAVSDTIDGQSVTRLMAQSGILRNIFPIKVIAKKSFGRSAE